jgi:ATP-dependent RNA helicase DeaD
MDKPTFASLGLSPEILKAVDALGFEEASPIQAAAIPILLQGGDVVGQSQTGSGKTAAFAIPAIEKIDPADRSVQVLILCPTRELATQVADEIHKLTAFKRGIHSVPIYGGASYDRQFYELNKGVQIVIGTPGRLIDHLERGTLKLDNLKVAILDECDRMLDMGFRDDIQVILDATPKARQMVFFSATLSRQIRDMIDRYSKSPEMVKIEQKEVTAPAIEQWYYEAHSRVKLDSLIRLVDYHGFKLGIIFCNTQRMVDELADTLLSRGFSADRLHGGISQAQRTRVMNKFKKSEFEFLVATDVAARGIDVDDLELVVNYDLPYDAEDYVHRIGRTGRAGKRGMAVTFVSGRDIYKLQFIERYTKTKIRRGTLPTAGEVEEKRADALLDKVRSTLEAREGAPQSVLVERLLEEGFNSTDICGALLQLLIGGPAESQPAEKESRRPARDEEKRPYSRRDEEPRSFSRRDEEPRKSFSREEAPPRKAFQREEASRKSFSREEEPRKESRREEAPSAPEEQRTPFLPRPVRGLHWVSVSVGKADGYGAREIVSVIAETGLPGKSVGSIELSQHQSFAQVPEDFAKGLTFEGNRINTEAGEILIRAVKDSGVKERTGGGKKFKGGFEKKFVPKNKKWKKG